MTAELSPNARSVGALWWVAERAARSMGASEIGSLHLWLALLADHNSRWARMVADYGGATYETAAEAIDSAAELWGNEGRGLPSAAELYPTTPQDSAPARSAPRRKRHTIAGFWIGTKAALRRAWRRLNHIPDPPRIPISNHARSIWHQAEHVGRPDPSVGHYLVVLASFPGEHQRLMNEQTTVIGAAARMALDMPRFADYCSLLLDTPRALLRLVDRRLESARRRRPESVPWRIAGALHWLLWVMFRLVSALVVGIVWVFVQAFLLPANLVLVGVRNVIALGSATRCEGGGFGSLVGREVAVSGVDDSFSPAPASTLLLPRLLLFALGVSLLLPFLLYIQVGGGQIFSRVFVRPDLLENVIAPLYLVGDMFDAYGPLGALGLTVAIGSLALSVPTHKELEQARLFLGHDIGLGSKVVRIAMAPWSTLVHISEDIDAYLAWTGGPVYRTVRFIPVLGGSLLALALSALIARIAY